MALAVIPAGTPMAEPQLAQATRKVTTTMPSVDVLLKQFERIAFSNEDGGRHRRGHIVKWNRPIRVAVVGEPGTRYMSFIGSVLRQLRRLSRLDMELIGWFEVFGVPNVTLHFLEPDANHDLLGGADCWTNVEDLPNFTISNVYIVVGSRDRSMLHHCIVEELTQALGLLDDSALIFPSIFNDFARPAGLYPWDEIMVQTLYDPRIRPGMTYADARPVAKQILSELRSQTIKARHTEHNVSTSPRLKN